MLLLRKRVKSRMILWWPKISWPLIVMTIGWIMYTFNSWPLIVMTKDVFCTTGHLWSWCNMWCWSILSDKIMPMLIQECHKFSLACCNWWSWFRSLNMWNVVTCALAWYIFRSPVVFVKLSRYWSGNASFYQVVLECNGCWIKCIQSCTFFFGLML